MRMFWKKNPAKFHPDQIRFDIWNDGGLGFFWTGRPNMKQKQEQGEQDENKAIGDQFLI